MRFARVATGRRGSSTYRYGEPFWSRSSNGWVYWGKHIDKVPEIPGPFDSEAEAREHAWKHGFGRPLKTTKGDAGAHQR